jgi:CheY-like chemotaxis protein
MGDRTEAPRALLVDDDEDTVVSLATLLEFEGVQVRTASSAAAALELAVSFRPHVAVIDIGLPEMDGFALCQCLREELPGCRMVAFSGYARPQDFQNSEAAGFDLHVAKPKNPVAAVMALLSESNERQSG